MKTFQIKKLINRVTKTSQPNNDNFTYYGNEVTLQSGTPDYVVVSVKTEKENVLEFDFDFLTKELIITFADTDETLNAILETFNNIYTGVKSTIK